MSDLPNPAPDSPREAGRKLDALIAERVFGWIWKLDEDVYGDGRRSGLYRVICDPKLWGDDDMLLGLATGSEPARIDRPYNGQRPPHYSTDIAAAWTVVEKATGYEIDGDRKPRRRHDVKLWFEGAEGEELFGTATADSLPHAICLAALAALTSETAAHV